MVSPLLIATVLLASTARSMVLPDGTLQLAPLDAHAKEWVSIHPNHLVDKISRRALRNYRVGNSSELRLHRVDMALMIVEVEGISMRTCGQSPIEPKTRLKKFRYITIVLLSPDLKTIENRK
ncbi:hypothetical protein F5Y04DRAFT_258575 [Hypomontagnella monticulosa]|nr:hypothetical protein F5Y04DRAFT_258575 [Hypomontagnella monticulosa]